MVSAKALRLQLLASCSIEQLLAHMQGCSHTCPPHAQGHTELTLSAQVFDKLCQRKPARCVHVNVVAVSDILIVHILGQHAAERVPAERSGATPQPLFLIVPDADDP